jgi:uncharacterized protein YjbK
LEIQNKDLDNLRKQKIDGLIIRSKAKWTELGKKSTNYVGNLENKNDINKNMHKKAQKGKWDHHC